MKLRGANERIGALTRVEVLVIIVLLIVLAGLFWPAHPPGMRQRALRINCVNNLKHVGLSFATWAHDVGDEDKYPMSVPATNGGTMELVPAGNVFPHFQVMSNILSMPKVVVCPTDTKRSAATNFSADFNDSHVSYFVGLDADETKHAMLLSGDRNISVSSTPANHGSTALATNSVVGWTKEIHNESGNILLVDGSVQQVNAAQFQKLLLDSGVTNRLAIP